jgi:drug/metabolite transporter (DMT)-like permease
MAVNRRGPADFFSAGYLLNHRVKEHGLPRWAWWTICLAASICVAAGVVTYLATDSWLAPGVFVLVGYLVVTATATFAEMTRRNRRTPD